MRRIPAWPALVTLLALSACDTNGDVGLLTKTTADVRVINASTVPIDLLQNQSIDAGNGNIAFGASSVCETVEIVSHGLSVRPAGSTSLTTPLPSFAANERYVVVATGSGNGIQVTPFRNSFTFATGKGAVRLINAAGAGASNYDIYVTDAGAALATASASNVAAGTASTYFDVATTAQQIRLTTNASKIVAFDLGTVTLAAGDRAVVIIAGPANGTAALRAFVLMIPSSVSC